MNGPAEFMDPAQSAMSASRGRRPSRARFLLSLLACGWMLLTGCSALQSLNGIPAVPAHRLPRELTDGPQKSDFKRITVTRLRQDPPDVYQLGPGDVLGVYIQTVLGNPEDAGGLPPVHFPEDPAQTPAIGYPIPVRDDGTIALPFVDPIRVEGLSLVQATDRVRKAYTEDRQILPEGKDRIIVTLMKKREHRILVIREESGNRPDVAKRGAGYVVNLKAYQNDLLHALNETGGLPGTDAENEVLVFHGQFADARQRDRLLSRMEKSEGETWRDDLSADAANVTRIPLRFPPGQPPAFAEDDIILETGDVVLIESRDDEVFYTGGLLGANEIMLPRDRDIDLLGAIAMAGNSRRSGRSGVQLGAVQTAGGGGGFGGRGGPGGLVPPTRVIILRQLPGGGQIPIRVNLNDALVDPGQRIVIRPGDHILLRYTPSEWVLNTALGVARFNFLFSGFSGDGAFD